MPGCTTRTTGLRRSARSQPLSWRGSCSHSDSCRCTASLGQARISFGLLASACSGRQLWPRPSICASTAVATSKAASAPASCSATKAARALSSLRSKPASASRSSAISQSAMLRVTGSPSSGAANRSSVCRSALRRPFMAASPRQFLRYRPARLPALQARKATAQAHACRPHRHPAHAESSTGHRPSALRTDKPHPDDF